MAKKQALGEGIGRLLGGIGSEHSVTGNPSSRGILHSLNSMPAVVIGSITTININSITENPDQPRKKIDEVTLKELASSIKEHGIIQPITVRKSGDGYQLISGERRLRASKIAGLREIPAYIRMVSEDKDMLELALIENIQRENLNAIDIALSYKGIQDAGNYTQEELSKRVGKDRTTISNYLRLLALPSEVQLAITENKISMGHARALLTASNPEKQVELLRAILIKHLSVRQVEALAKRKSGAKKGVMMSRSAAIPFEDKVTALSAKTDTEVTVKVMRGGKGTLAMQFSSLEDLEKILNTLILG